MSFDKDCWQTPRYVFNWLNNIYQFDIDGCANHKNALTTNYIGRFGVAESFLEFDLIELITDYAKADLRFWVNPPYSNPLPFVQRAVELMKSNCTVVMLLPADKSTKWYQVIQQNASEVIDIIGGRLAFVHPETGEQIKGNNKGSMVAVFDPNYQGLISRQVSLDFIKRRGA